MELPFLCHTRTILRHGKASTKWTRTLLRPRARFRCLHQKGYEVQDQASFFREKAEEVAAKINRPENSTITRQEKRAFDNLRRIAGQNQPSSHYSDLSPQAERLNVDPQKILDLFTPPPALNRSHDAVINRICQKYMSLVSTSFTEALNSTSSPGDIGLWRVLERRVFPLLTFLKHQDEISQDEQRDLEKAFSIAEFIADDLESQHFASTHLSSPDDTDDGPQVDHSTLTPLPFLTRLYPATVLLAFRLLAKHYPLSPLSHSLLPHIRSLGASSYVLGANTHFYNTLLFLRWNVYSSLREVCDLLSEMERGAVEFDRGTYRFLSELAEERLKDLMEPGSPVKGQAGAALRGAKWWQRTEQVRWWPKVDEWRGIMARRLEEKGMGEVIREGPVNGDGVGLGAQHTGGEVWL